MICGNIYKCIGFPLISSHDDAAAVHVITKVLTGEVIEKNRSVSGYL